MQLLRKALALVTLMVFLPATVLAAMPIKLCFGADGHRAIKSMIGGGHYDAAAYQYVDADTSLSNLATPADDCVDRSILTTATSAVANSGDQSKLLALDKIPPVVLNGAVGPPSPLARPSRCISNAVEVIDTNPFLVAHATDVLLN